MSLPAVAGSRADRTTRIERFGKPPGVSNARPRSNAQMRRVLQTAATISALMLVMFGGFALRAAFSLTQGFH